MHTIELFHLNTVPKTLYEDIMPYFDKKIHSYGCNLSAFWPAMKNRRPKLSISSSLMNENGNPYYH